MTAFLAQYGLSGVSRALVGVLAAATILAVVNTLGYWAYTTDDAFITLRYSWHLAQGHGLVFNPGEWVEGYSNPLWTLVLTVPLLLGFDGMVAAKVVSLICHLASLIGAGLLARALLDDEGWKGVLAAGIAAGFLAISLPATWWASQALETSSYSALLVFSLWRLAREKPGDRPVSAVLAGLATISRPEAPLLVAGIWAGRLLKAKGEQTWAPLRRWSLVMLAPGVAWLSFRLIFYGAVLPNTYHHKGNGTTLLVHSWDYLRPWIMLEGVFLGLGVLGAALLLRSLRRPVVLGTLAVLLAQIAFLVFFGVDWMPNQRFLVPGLPLLGACLSAGVLTLASSRPLALGLGVLLASSLAWQGNRSWPVRLAGLDQDGSYETVPRTDKDLWPTSAEAGFRGSNNVVAAWLLQRIPPGATLAYSEIGLTAYAGPWVVLDLIGLTDRVMCGATGLDTQGRMDYVQQREPDWIVLKNYGPDHLRKLIEQPWLERDYVLEEGPKGLVVARRKDAALASPDQVHAALDHALSVAPRFGSFHMARVSWADSLSDPAQACESLAQDLPRAVPLQEKCARLLAQMGRGGTQSSAPAAGSDAAAGIAVPDLQAVENSFAQPGQWGVGLGWYALPESIGQVVRLEDDALRLDGRAEGADPPLVCFEQPVSLEGPAQVVGRWRLENVDGPRPWTGARVVARFFRPDGTLIRGANQRIVAATGTQGWTDFAEVLAPPDGVVGVKICAELPAATGTAWLQSVAILRTPNDPSAI
jgi:hypothetical protein